MQGTGRRATTALREAIRQLPSTVARLAFLAGLRDPNSGTYRHAIASSEAEKAEVDCLSRGLHEETFAIWLNYRLEEQKADLDLYFSGLDCGKAAVVQTWLRLESYRALVPASASSQERQLFFSEMGAHLELMAKELSLATGSSDEAERSAPNKPLLTTKDLSGWLGFPTRTLRLWAEHNEIPAVKIGRQWRFPGDDIRKWLKRRRGNV